MKVDTEQGPTYISDRTGSCSVGSVQQFVGATPSSRARYDSTAEVLAGGVVQPLHARLHA